MAKTSFNGFPRDRKSSINPEVQRRQDLTALVSQMRSAQKYFRRDVDEADYIVYCEKIGIPITQTVEQISDDLSEACRLHVGGITRAYNPDTGTEFYHVPEIETRGDDYSNKRKSKMFSRRNVLAMRREEIPRGGYAFQ